jgi:hypothetical protein
MILRQPDNSLLPQSCVISYLRSARLSSYTNVHHQSVTLVETVADNLSECAD